MKAKDIPLILTALIGTLVSGAGRAQVTAEDFTGTATTNSWYFSSGACLTAGTSTSTTSPGQIPGCTTSTIASYYTAAGGDTSQYGGSLGYLGGSSAPASFATETPDAVGSGALRFTNGAPKGNGEKGSIMSATTFPTNAGLQITFKTVSYKGDSGTNYSTSGVSDGADGTSFFLMDGSAATTNNIGPSGGTLA